MKKDFALGGDTDRYDLRLGLDALWRVVMTHLLYPATKQSVSAHPRSSVYFVQGGRSKEDPIRHAVGVEVERRLEGFQYEWMPRPV